MRHVRAIVIALLVVTAIVLTAAFVYFRATAAPVLDKDMSFFEAGRPELAKTPAIRRMAMRAQLDCLCNPIRDQFIDLGGGPIHFARAYRNEATGELELVFLPWFSHVTDVFILYRFSAYGRMSSKEIQ